MNYLLLKIRIENSIDVILSDVKSIRVITSENKDMHVVLN